MTWERMDEILLEMTKEYHTTTQEVIESDLFLELKNRISQELGFGCWLYTPFYYWFNKVVVENQIPLH